MYELLFTTRSFRSAACSCVPSHGEASGTAQLLVVDSQPPLPCEPGARSASARARRPQGTRVASPGLCAAPWSPRRKHRALLPQSWRPPTCEPWPWPQARVSRGPAWRLGQGPTRTAAGKPVLMKRAICRCRGTKHSEQPREPSGCGSLCRVQDEHLLENEV